MLPFPLEPSPTPTEPAPVSSAPPVRGIAREWPPPIGAGLPSPFAPPVRSAPPPRVACSGVAPAGVTACMDGEPSGGGLACIEARTPLLDEDLKAATGGCPLVSKVLAGPYCHRESAPGDPPACCYLVESFGCVGRPLLLAGAPALARLARRAW
jgi:hypothetical protein